MTRRILLALVLGLLAAVVSTFSQSSDLAFLAQYGVAQDVQAAIDGGANVNEREAGSGVTPLIKAAASNKDAGVITVLLQAGADINARTNDQGQTALMMAAIYNHNPEVLMTLLQAGADPKVRSYSGRTAFDYAQDNVALFGTEALAKLRDASR